MIATAQPGRVASQREVARRLGISHTALQKAQRAGRIAPEADGAWDVEKVRARLADSSDPVRKTASLVQPAVAAPRPASPPPVAAMPPAADPLPRAAQNTFHDARTANEVLKAQERRLRLDERKGKLVDKARALLLVHRLAKEERDAILAWPARVAAEMAAELGLDAHRLQTMMDTRLRQHLAERHDVRVSVG
ncbi:elements of external origin [Siccirubricoccus sp. KC 17139]|uniref:Elements of external origin n=1 Tax=Siccirubricoccus soli TaxID=2899147 RepID=A0ABT1D2C3_9PROT|nr:elements of external origin [Siccirubricoccus soli]MCO6415170.1 elements of external origin [Siccirubricoccus soli]MCP2681301.1 elements of external origin [Siccirubricoccus soli]